MAWVKTQKGSLVDVSSVSLPRKKGEKPTVVDGDGNKLATYSRIGQAEVVMADFEKWLSGYGKSMFGGNKRVFSFPSPEQVE